MKKILMLTAALCVFAACNKDEVKEVNRGSAIDFRMAMDTKATEYSASNLEQFNVVALTDEGAVYFSDVFKKNASAYFMSETPYYWPSSGNLHFYAYYPDLTDAEGNSAFTIDEDTKTLTGYTPDSDISNQKDVIIAKAQGNMTDNRENGIPVEFVHQLSKIEVWADNTNQGFVYKLKGIRMANVYSSGDLDFSDVSVWTTGDEKVTYEVLFEEIELTSASELTDLLATVGGFAMLVPQSTVAWDIEEPANESAGSYWSLKVQINTADGTRIYPPKTADEEDEEFGWMATPVSFNWAPGVNYKYALHLGSGGGFAEPGENDTEVEDIFGGEMQFTVGSMRWKTTIGTNPGL